MKYMINRVTVGTVVLTNKPQPTLQSRGGNQTCSGISTWRIIYRVQAIQAFVSEQVFAMDS
jgi:hypothetical protein